MREIDLDKPSNARRTILAYGNTRSGKTHWSATAPRPLFISDATESGWTTVMNMDRSLWWEPNVKPLVWPIDTITDMAEAFAKAQPLVAAGTVRTVIIDSLTFYADLYLAWAFGQNSDNRKAYGLLNVHLRDLRVKWHALQCNVIWLCLAKEPDEENKIGGPMIPGQQAGKFGAGVDNILYFRSPDKTQFFVHTKKYGAFPTGGREGNRIVADPLPVSSFRAFLEAIGDPMQSVDTPPLFKPTIAPAKPAQQPHVRGPVARGTVARRA